MDMKRVASRTLFFLAICVVVGIISKVFGQVNSLVGVAIVVIALMMLQRDLSVSPLWNTGTLILFTCMLGVGSYLALIDPFLGIFVNIAVVFTTVFLTVHDLNSPLHFPFILGYAFMLSVPVTAEELPMRILALVVGSIATVVLNVLLNRNSMKRTSHNAVVSMCKAIEEGAEKVLAGEEVSSGNLERLCSDLNSKVYDRLRDRVFASHRDSHIVDLMASLMNLGRTVFERERDPEVLSGIRSLMTDLRRHEDGETSLEDVLASIEGFLSANKGADFGIISSVRAIGSELKAISSETPGTASPAGAPAAPKLSTLFKENFRRDSVRFTFAVRMSFMFTLWVFVWQYWELENAKWLLYTTAAIVQPYVEGTWMKSGMRVAGTLVGTAIFGVIALACGGDPGILALVLMVVSYIYTLVDPKRYDLMMGFITLTALLAASAADPAGDIVVERILYILGGVLAATLANMTILPYRLRDESVELGRRYLKVSSRQMDGLRELAETGKCQTDDTYLVMTAGAIASKMQVNDGREPDRPFGKFISSQNALTAECSLLSNSLSEAGEACRAKVGAVLGSRKDGGVPDMEGLDESEKEIVVRTANVVSMYRENRMMLADAAVDLPD